MAELIVDAGGQSERERFIYEMGIITGFMATSYAVSQAAPHIGPLTVSLLERVSINRVKYFLKS